MSCPEFFRQDLFQQTGLIYRYGRFFGIRRIHFIEVLLYLLAFETLLLAGCAGGHSPPLSSTTQTTKSQGDVDFSGRLVPRRAPPEALPATPAGRIIVIHQRHHFVLLDTSSLPHTAPGTLLTCVSGSYQTALLRASHQYRYPFLIADIIQGNPSIGEQAFSMSP